VPCFDSGAAKHAATAHFALRVKVWHPAHKEGAFTLFLSARWCRWGMSRYDWQKEVRMAQGRGTCDACGKSPRVLTVLDDGQGVCRTCLRHIRPPRPRHLATLKQIDYAQRLGYRLCDDISRHDISAILGRHHFAYYYVLDVWESIVGQRAKQQGIDHNLIHQFVSALSQIEPRLLEQIEKIQSDRDDLAYSKSEEINEAIAAGCDAWIRHHNDGRISTPSLNELKPAIAKNRTYRKTAKLLKRHFPQFAKQLIASGDK
jgi:hypothetical protein